MKRAILLTTIVMAFSLYAMAGTFVVTSNADDGTGTLREAIVSANADIAQATDTITFNIAGGDFASRTIYLLSALPTIGRPMVVDGTTQPNGGAFGKSDAKIKIANTSLSITSGLNIQTINTEIYGLYITGFADGISLQQAGGSANAQIGAITKGNLINNAQDACIKMQLSDHVIVNGNLIGTDSVGRDGFTYGLPFSGNGIIVSSCFEISIGEKGLNSGSSSGNSISHCSIGISLEKDSYVRIMNNSIGSSRAGWVAVPNGTGILGTGNNLYVEVGGDTAEERNVISGNFQDGIEGEFSYSYFKGNHVGVDGTGNNGQGNGRYGIYLQNGSTWNQIGDSTTAGENTIAYNGYEGIALQNSTCTNNSIRINIMTCNSTQNPNGVGGIALNLGNNAINAPEFLDENSCGMTGRTTPGSVVDFYKDDGDCAFCEGRAYVSSSQTDSAGIFTLSGNYLPYRITAIVTDPTGNSSEFSNCSRRDDSTICLTPGILGPTGSQCSNVPLIFYDQTVTVPCAPIVSRAWNFGDGNFSNAAAPIHAYAAGGTYNVVLTDVNSIGCTASDSITVVVANAPAAAFTSEEVVCTNTPVSFTNTSSGGAGDSIIHYLWEFGDGSIDTTADPIHIYTDTVATLVTLTVTNSHGCSATLSLPIEISLAPTANFSAGVSSCNMTITNNSVIGSHTSVSWNFGDGTTSTEFNPPVHSYPANGTYNVLLSITDSVCNVTKTATQSVFVFACVSGINEVKDSKDVKIVPNPAGSNFYIQNNLQESIESVELFDVVGRRVFEIPSSNIQPHDTYQVNLPSLANGVYTLRMKTATSYINVKVVENK